MKDTGENLREWLFSNTFCRAGRHCRRENRVWKFNGGAGAWLCRNCRLIVKYGHVR